MASASGSSKPEKSPLVELKNGKVLFKQKCPSFEKLSETLGELAKFREMMERRIERGEPPLSAVPEDHLPLIVKLAHESDKSFAVLCKHIRKQLLPAPDEDEDPSIASKAETALPLKTVEGAIASVLTRVNYGLEPNASGKQPVAICIWRWEVKDEHHDWLPKNGRDKADIRLAERIQAKKDTMALFQALSTEERDALYDPKGTGKAKDTKVNMFDTAVPVVDLTNPKPPSQHMNALPENQENDVPLTSQHKVTGAEKPVKDKEKKASKADKEKKEKEIDPEKASKEREKQEKKAAKAEKEKKDKEAQIKSKNIMANFFNAKSKPTATASQTSGAGPSRLTPSGDMDFGASASDFEKTFKPFVVKKDAILAPTNWFLDQKGKRRGSSCAQAITIDCDMESIKEEDVEMTIEDAEDDVSRMTPKDHLQSILRSLSRSGSSPLRPPHAHLPSGYKTWHPRPIRDVMASLTEAEIAGDISLVRNLQSSLSNPVLYPLKSFIFTDDARPGYLGTWTRCSKLIGPRSPLARDLVVFDYGYDSGEEWEDEPVGDADDVDAGGDDDDEDSNPDSDLDSWLVDDDQVIEEGVGSPSEELDFLLPPRESVKRKKEVNEKIDEGERKLGKKRKVVVPLVPFAKGPCWEQEIGQCQYDPFKSYRIQLFNDTPLFIDPFTFVSTMVPDKKSNHNDKEGAFAVPSLPERLAQSMSLSTNSSPHNSPASFRPQANTFATASSSTPTGAPAKKAAPPKTPFPDAYLPQLLAKITSLATGNFTFLVESVYQELKAHGVKKNAIEAKVKEVSSKAMGPDSKLKCWIVNPEFRGTA